jgi:hypothetical protein
MHETSNNAMALQLQPLLETFGLIHCVIIFVKYDGNNLGTMFIALKSIIDCESFKLL